MIVKVTHPDNRLVHHHVLDFDRYKGEVGIVACAPKGDHNSVRRAFALIHKVIGPKSCPVYDIMLMECGDRWHLCVYIHNWPGRAGYYAGQLVGYLKATRRTANHNRKTSISF